MTNTPLGFPRPVATDRIALGYDQISDLADAIDAYLTATLAPLAADTGWINAGFSMGSGWTDTGCRYRKVGKLLQIDIDAFRAGVALGSPATGNMTNSTVVTVPSAARPPGDDMAVAWTSDETNGGGNLLSSSGVFVISSMNSTSTIAVGSTLRSTVLFLVP